MQWTMVGALTLLTFLLASSGAHASSYRPRYGYYGVLHGMLLYCGSMAMSHVYPNCKKVANACRTCTLLTSPCQTCIDFGLQLGLHHQARAIRLEMYSTVRICGAINDINCWNSTKMIMLPSFESQAQVVKQYFE
jgi:hypothetical protein